MDKKSKVLFIVFGIIFLTSIAVTYYRYMIKKDYIIESQVDCDPEAEKCFIWKCDPDAIDEEEKCVGNIEDDNQYFKIARRTAGNIPLCNPKEDEACEPMKCESGEKGCEEILCAEDNLEKYYVTECNDPDEYNIENAPEEENAEEEGEGEVTIESEESEESEEMVDDKEMVIPK